MLSASEICQPAVNRQKGWAALPLHQLLQKMAVQAGVHLDLVLIHILGGKHMGSFMGVARCRMVRCRRTRTSVCALLYLRTENRIRFRLQIQLRMVAMRQTLRDSLAQVERRPLVEGESEHCGGEASESCRTPLALLVSRRGRIAALYSTSPLHLCWWCRRMVLGGPGQILVQWSELPHMQAQSIITRSWVRSRFKPGQVTLATWSKMFQDLLLSLTYAEGRVIFGRNILFAAA